MTDTVIYADGASSGNGANGKGGWAATIIRGRDEITVSGNSCNATNNQMELTAVIEAISMLRSGESATINSDSQYVVNGINLWVHEWRKKGWVTAGGTRVVNKELWEKLIESTQRNKLTFKWCRGHSNEQIDFVDKIAKQRSKELL